MNNVSVVLDRNEKTNQYEIKKIVIFRNGEAPIIKDTPHITDLIQVNEFAEKVGMSLTKEGGFLQALESGFLTLMTPKMVDEMAKLQARITAARLTDSNLIKNIEAMTLAKLVNQASSV